MITTIITVAAVGYFGYLAAGAILCIILGIIAKDWEGLYGGFGLMMKYSGLLGICCGVWAFLVGYGLKYLTYNNVNIVKECNIAGIAFIVVSIIAIYVGDKMLTKVNGGEYHW